MPSRSRRFFLNAVSLTATALIMRTVGVLFNIYVSNTAGAESMGLYSLLGGVYGFALTVAAAGVNLGTVRSVSEALGQNNKRLAMRSVTCALLVCLCSSMLATSTLYALSRPIGVYVLSDERTVTPLKILALTLIPVAVCSALSGYFTAVRRVKINAASQILVQIIKIAATAFLLSRFLPRTPQNACIALCAGGAVAEFVSLAVTFSLYLLDRKKHLPRARDDENAPKISYGAVTGDLLSITLPVTIASCARSGLTTLLHVIIPRGLRQSGKSWQAALSSYGILQSMVLPVVLFPSAFISSFSGLLIPEIAECKIQGATERIKRISYRILTLSLFFSIGVSGVMFCLSDELGMTIYHSSEAARYIRILAPLIPIMYIDSAVDAILKGMGHQVYSMGVNIADAAASCLLALLLIPRFGIDGYIISIYATECLNTALSLAKMLSVTKMKPKPIHQVLLPIACVLASTVVARYILKITHHPFSPRLELVLHIGLTLLLYLVALLITRAIGNEETEALRASMLPEAYYNKRYGEKREKNF